MKQYLLFAGREHADLKGVQTLVGSFGSFAEAFVSLVDRQTPSEWWHILDTATGEVVERRHLKVHNGMIGFEQSTWIAGQPSQQEPAPAPAAAITVSLPKAADLNALEADLRSAVATGLTGSKPNGHAHGAANGKAHAHANGAAAEH